MSQAHPVVKAEPADGTWFSDLLMTFAPDAVSVGGRTPEEMVRKASWSAFGISTVASLPPGLLGWATILPEIMAVTRIQMNLIYNIADYYGKRPKLSPALILLIFANEAGVQLAKPTLRRIGTKVLVRAIGSRALRPLAQKVGARIGIRISQRLIGRWVPLLLAPVFGAFSKAMTTKVGQEAISLFRGDLEVVETSECSQGHEFDGTARFCPECGEAQ